MVNKNKIALVTGGSRGLGKDMALKLGEKGIDVVLTYHSKGGDAEAVVSEIKKKGGNAAALQLDTGKVNSFDGFIETLKSTLKSAFDTDRIDFLVNNAGTGASVPFTDVSEQLFDDLLNVHFKGVFFLTQKVLNILNDHGGIVNISSGLTRFSFPGSTPYACMKGAVEVFSRYLAKELGARGIRANTVAPGAIATDFNGGHVRDNEQVNKAVSGFTALGRVGVAEDIGGVVAFLCTEEGRWVNGQRLEVSGGMML